MKQYFYSNDGLQHGPFTLEQLRVWPRSKEIQPDTLITPHDSDTWKPAVELAEFHSILGIPPPEIVETTSNQRHGFLRRFFTTRQTSLEDHCVLEQATSHNEAHTQNQADESIRENTEEEEFAPPPIPDSTKKTSTAKRRSFIKVGCVFVLSSIKNAYKKSFMTFGRTSVLEYLSFQLFFLTFVIVFGNFEHFTGITGDVHPALGELEVLLVLPFIILSVPAQISINIRRMHDLGRSGWWLLLVGIPYMGLLIILAIYLIPGNRELNKYDNSDW